MDKKKIVFLSGTRADYGKLQPLILETGKDQRYEVHIFITGMHMLERYGGTAREILKEFSNVYMYNNQAFSSRLEVILSNTISGFSYYISGIKPDLIVVHGDRVEAIAGAIVGSFNNILVAHIEGGEISGTIDESIRHSISKLAHLHFVANQQAKNRLIQMGENSENIYIIGSPDIDIMFSDSLASKEEVLKYYEIEFDEFAILIYHSVTTEVNKLSENVKQLVDAVMDSELNYIIIYPNNDPGCEIIFNEYEKFNNLKNFKLFPSMQFQKFLVLLKHTKFIIGNSSAGIREAPIYCIPTINVGTRQNNRFIHKSIFNVSENKDAILNMINNVIQNQYEFSSCHHFGDGKSVKRFMKEINQKEIWKTNVQKQFIDL